MTDPAKGRGIGHGPNCPDFRAYGTHNTRDSRHCEACGLDLLPELPIGYRVDLPWYEPSNLALIDHPLDRYWHDHYAFAPWHEHYYDSDSDHEYVRNPRLRTEREFERVLDAHEARHADNPYAAPDLTIPAILDWPDGALRPATAAEFYSDGMPLRVHHKDEK